jgi:hypothetical protein
MSHGVRTMRLGDCLKESVFYEILGLDFERYRAVYAEQNGKNVQEVKMEDLLTTVYDDSCYERDIDGSLRFYDVNVHGTFSYDPRGKFIAVVGVDNQTGRLSRRYVHVAEVFLPVDCVRRELNAMMILFAVAYLQTQKQVAQMESLSRQSEMIVSRLRELNKIYARMTIQNSAYKNEGAGYEVATCGPDFWEALVDAGVVDLYHAAITGVRAPFFILEFRTSSLEFWKWRDWYMGGFNMAVDGNSRQVSVNHVSSCEDWIIERGGNYNDTIKNDAAKYYKNIDLNPKNIVTFLSNDEPINFRMSCPEASYLDACAVIIRNAFMFLANTIMAGLKWLFSLGQEEVKLPSLKEIGDLRYWTALTGNDDETLPKDDPMYGMLYYRLLEVCPIENSSPKDSGSYLVSVVSKGEGIEHNVRYASIDPRINMAKYATHTPVIDVLRSKGKKNEAGESLEIISYVPLNTVKSLTDKIRIFVEQLNTELSRITTVINSAVQDYFQVNTLASELLSNFGSQLSKGAKNIVR